MKNTTNPTNFTSTVEVVPNSNNTALHDGDFEQLAEILSRYGATGYIKELQAIDFTHKHLVYMIDSGDKLERDPNEDTAQVLADLRAYYTPTIRELSERAYFIKSFNDLVLMVERMVSNYQHKVYK